MMNGSPPLRYKSTPYKGLVCNEPLQGTSEVNARSLTPGSRGNSERNPMSFIKWVGGKRAILDELIARSSREIPKRVFILLFIIFDFASCSNKKREVELQNRIFEIKTQLDECRNGADKLLAKIKIAFEDKDFASVKTIYFDFRDHHPEAVEFKEGKIIYEQVLSIEEAERKKQKGLAELAKKERLRSLKKLKKKYDDVSGITWYKQPYFTHYNNSNLTSIYIGDDGSYAWLRLKMSYYGDNWIFFKKAYLSFDGNTKEIVFNEYDDKETENEGGGVWEWIDVKVSNDLQVFLREFAKSKSAKMRLSGKYTETRKLTYKERQGILVVLDGYHALEKRDEIKR